MKYNLWKIGTDEDHIHFMVQSVPSMSVSKIVQIIKSITAREVIVSHPEVKKALWGATFGQVVFMLIQ